MRLGNLLRLKVPTLFDRPVGTHRLFFLFLWLRSISWLLFRLYPGVVLDTISDTSQVRLGLFGMRCA